MQSSARHIRGFLQGSDAVTALLLELQRREALLERIRSLLPASVAGHCTQATLDDGRLTLICDSPAWVDRLRFLSPQFLPALAELLAEQGEAVDTCRVRARPCAPAPQKMAERCPLPGAGSSAVQAVEQTAAALGDTPLAASLRRLAGSLRCSR
ncbi:MAG: DUF721 domain-containing protein [Thiohalocapsa sp.]|jgi:hypothetical protein|uniref:DUF721 domain-containing protein n=1 Tax=Thiohalocapsa sp. TaxID=2497641 RepID=UPI0025F02B59|nr:DUF721 domain-containing protein [Thiohalocapsa sp.]MCG6943029.1 DUF721 domain-containing protein [Thiohalocapsa sp.]